MWEAVNSAQLTVVILVDGHGGWLQDTDFESLMDPERDFIRFFVRNLQEGQIMSAGGVKAEGSVSVLPCPGR